MAFCIMRESFDILKETYDSWNEHDPDHADQVAGREILQ